MKQIIWNYNPPKPQEEDFWWRQEDWSQTLLTRINQAGAELYQEKAPANILVVHSQEIANILCSIEYFRPYFEGTRGLEGFIAGRWSVYLLPDSEKKNEIKVFGIKNPSKTRTIIIENYPFLEE